jgi:hypothetical protein
VPAPSQIRIERQCAIDKRSAIVQISDYNDHRQIPQRTKRLRRLAKFGGSNFIRKPIAHLLDDASALSAGNRFENKSFRSFRAARVPLSSASMSRLYPTTSATRMAERRRSTERLGAVMDLSLPQRWETAPTPARCPINQRRQGTDCPLPPPWSPKADGPLSARSGQFRFAPFLSKKGPCLRYPKADSEKPDRSATRHRRGSIEQAWRALHDRRSDRWPLLDGPHMSLRQIAT